MKVGLRRYTNLGTTIHILRSKGLTLLSPEYWDDRNDRFYMATYKQRMQVRSLLALCFAEAKETYHHWRVFSAGSDGVCLEFKKDRLIDAMTGVEGLKWGSVEYRPIGDTTPIETHQLPFLKRIPYEDEREFRLLYTSATLETEAYHVPIPLSCIVSLSLSPWMAKPLVEAVRATLKGIGNDSHNPVLMDTSQTARRSPERTGLVSVPAEVLERRGANLVAKSRGRSPSGPK